MSSPAQIAANRGNSKLSTGPRTPAGKAVSSMNNFKLGLACRTFAVLEIEDQDEFNQYTEDLIVEYGVETKMEYTLVLKLAQHHWLSQRAFFAEQTCFGDYAIPETEAQERRLALMLRYQAHHDRAFHKTRNELEKLIAARRKQPQTPAPKHVQTQPAQPRVKRVAAAPAPQPVTSNPPIAVPATSKATSAVPINDAA